MKRPNIVTWKNVSLTVGLVLAGAGAGCATTSTAPALAAALGGEDTEHACAGVPAKERDLGLLTYRDAIGGTAPWHERVRISKGVEVDQEVGVRIAVRAQPGLTAPWLARVATCHASLAAANQIEAADAKNDPLRVPGVAVSVDEAATGFIVSVRAPNAIDAADVKARSVAMANGQSLPPTAQAETSR
jgi:hypothetical protein